MQLFPPTRGTPHLPSDGVAAAVVAACLCNTLLTPHAGAVSDALAAAPSTTVAQAQQAAGSTVADEAWALLDKYYLDRSFNGYNWPAERQRLRSVGPMTDKQGFDEAERLVSKLGDKYSRVLGPEQAAKLNKFDVTGVGLNLIISDSGEMKVGSVPAPGTVAADAGIRFGDRVLSINSRTTSGMTSFDALEAIQGEGKTVDVTVQSPGLEARDLALPKAFVVKDPVQTKLVSAGSSKVGYIKLREFNARCKRRVGEALDELQRAGATKLVLDLRGNGGGVLDGALGISGFFMERPLVLFITDANGSRQPLYSRQGAVTWAAPLEVWVNGRSASSSEVLAGALHDNCRARVIGSTTYGKGLIQGVFGLSDGAALVTTVASYATPSGREINLQGVAPDESHVFWSDVLGSLFVDLDIQGTRFSPPVCKDAPVQIAGARPQTVQEAPAGSAESLAAAR